MDRYAIFFSGTPFQSYNTHLVPADLSNQFDLSNNFTFLAHFDSVSKVKIDTKSLKYWYELLVSKYITKVQNHLSIGTRDLLKSILQKYKRYKVMI